MTTMKGFVLFNVFLMSTTLWTALDRTISAGYFAELTADAGLFWWGSLLLLIVFAVGLCHIRKVRQAAPAEPPYVGKARGLLLVSSLCYSVVVFDIQRVVERISSPQLPLALKVWFVVLTIINLGAFLWWTADNYRKWRKGRDSFIRAA